MERKPILDCTPGDKLVISVEYVFRANFNDSYYLETHEIDIDSLSRDELYWFDPYFGRSKIGNTRVALAEYSKESFTFIEKNSEKTKEQRLDPYMTFISCEDYDDAMLLASHIRLSGHRKENK